MTNVKAENIMIGLRIEGKIYLGALQQNNIKTAPHGAVATAGQKVAANRQALVETEATTLIESHL